MRRTLVPMARYFSDCLCGREQVYLQRNYEEQHSHSSQVYANYTKRIALETYILLHAFHHRKTIKVWKG